MSIDIHAGDAVQWANEYEGEPFHAMLCDPPYELGFMARAWDSTGVAFRSETWAAFRRVLYPGAFGMAFASSRGWHRLAVAIEDAGFTIHPTIFCWANGAGFPKATAIDKAIDKAAGAEVKSGHGFSVAGPGRDNQLMGTGGKPDMAHEPVTDEAKTWAGYKYGLQALKPAVEPCIVFQRPYEGRPMDCITASGAGALNIDGGRIGTHATTTNAKKARDGNGIYGASRECPARENPPGRFPANLILLDGGAAEAMDRQSGLSISRGGVVTSGASSRGTCGYSGGYEGIATLTPRDAGGASRFFYSVQDRLDECDPVY
jgi:site-specific DNA-methyltransferase (adenine-specific)